MEILTAHFISNSVAVKGDKWVQYLLQSQFRVNKAVILSLASNDRMQSSLRLRSAT